MPQNPQEGITLSMRAIKVEKGDSGTLPKIGGPLPPGVDGAVLAELKLATRTFDYLRQFGEPIELWEAVRLARSRRGVVVGEDGNSSVNPGMAEELQVIRRQLSPMVRDLRRFLLKVPDLPPAGESLELALGFLLASSREHQAVAKWLAESDANIAKAAGKLRSLATIAAPYIEVLRPWSLAGPQPLAAATKAPAPGGPALKSAPAAAPPAPPAAPIVLDPELMDSFRRALASRQIFIETELSAAFWEVLLLNCVERIPCQSKLGHIEEARRTRKLAVFHEEARNLHARLLPIRARQGRWVEVLNEYLRSLPGMPKDSSLFDMALAFAIIEPGAQDRARRWLGNPEASAAEASAHLYRLAEQVKAYVAGAKKADA